MPLKKGRKQKKPAIKVPSIDMALADRIEEFLKLRFEMKRPPVEAAKLLALVVELYRLKSPFPTRAAVSAELGCSVYTIDAAISTYLEREMISMDWVIHTGGVKTRDGVFKYQVYKPTQELLTAIGSRMAA